ncbi:adenylate/guanylate cyclase domain-containing protein [Mesorhizobium sp. BAC0120]|uniref:adenylate/guanylate cyclase domain-containing protein n=1 Tax=Mesorhizobium sp. BAC0120 TaxID=3090670 RepID=UPI00298CC580|nr:adenylate/guanylate cyclase domain-containing protein [Mesorhizobium sp. BAC0120]MDW6020413.1 adenylate/guanylate cyclase domain-containing protein [Mesorhizobium sp. BAC0120]
MARTRVDAEFKRRASLAIIWQDLVMPVRAILGYQEIIVEEGQRLRLDDVLPYLDQVLIAAGMLSDLVDRILEIKADAETGGDDPDSFQAKLRHDLRTSLNAIIGYSEMVIEDLDRSIGADALRPDLERLLVEARQLLNRIDAIVDLSRGDTARADIAESQPAAAAEAAIVSLLHSLRPDESSPKHNEAGRILVVDDNSTNRDLLNRRLMHEGHEVVGASSGLEALSILEQDRFDLILLDLLMPDMNGIEVLERLKADERWHSIPVIMISGLSETDAVIRCIEAGADDYLPKPFNHILLRARINACLDRKRWHDREQEYLAQLEAEKERSEALLRNILPSPVVARLNAGETLIADRFENVSILFADLVEFTPAAALITPSRLVERLNRVFSQFDMLALRLGVEKIKTIGDAYMAATGLPEPQPDHTDLIAQFGLGMLTVLEQINGTTHDSPLRIRVGIHTGPVVAGIIGHHKFIYDVWGDTVNVASRLEANSLPGRIQVSEAARRALAGRYSFESRGRINLKGRGGIEAFLLIPPVVQG